VRGRFVADRVGACRRAGRGLGECERLAEPSTAAYSGMANSAFTMAYDAAGRPVTETEPGGDTVTDTYNSLNELTGQSVTGTDAAATPTRSFGYDTARNMTSADSAGRFAKAHETEIGGTVAGIAVYTGCEYPAGGKDGGACSAASGAAASAVSYAITAAQKDRRGHRRGQRWDARAARPE
jgi:YD repeat-containing protein